MLFSLALIPTHGPSSAKGRAVRDEAGNENRPARAAVERVLLDIFEAVTLVKTDGVASLE